MSALSAVLVIVAVACLLIMALLLSAAGRSRRDIRSSIFPIVREEGAARVQRARIGATIAAVIAAMAAVAFFVTDGAPMPPLQVSLPALPQLLPEVPELPQLVQAPASPTPMPEPTVTPLPSPPPEPTATSTALPTATVSTPEATATAMPTPTRAATSTRAGTPAQTPTLAVASAPSPTASTEPTGTPPVSASPTARPSPVPLPTDARLGPLTFSLELDSDANPVNPTRVFSNTAARIYAVFPFEGMRKGLLWTRVWYFNNMEFARDEDAWQWGERARSYVFIKPVGAGEYRLDLLVNDRLLTSGKFTVIGPTAIGGPQTP